MDVQKALVEIKQKRFDMKKDQVLPVEEDPVKKPDINPYMDPMDRIRTSETPKPRLSKQLKFAEPGKFIAIANNIRAQESMEKLKQEISQTIKSAGMEKELELVADSGLRTIAPPKVEWWDAKLVSGCYESFNIMAHNPIVEELVTKLVQHPVPIQPPASQLPPPPKPLILTKKEQKKLRRQNRREVQQDKQDRIRLGLLPEEAPRLTKANFMRVLGEEAVLNPSAIEAKMHEQVLDRQQKHKKLIEESKLTPEERKEKKREKLKEDTSSIVTVCLFK
jgi:U4/U6 small nuclear ribonucleoprotein PRP3